MEINSIQSDFKSLNVKVGSEAVKVEEKVASAVENKPTPKAVIEEQVKLVNSAFEASGQNLSFSVDDAANTFIVKLVDKETGEVIRQMPGEESLRVMKNIQSHFEMVNQSVPQGREGLTGAGGLISKII